MNFGPWYEAIILLIVLKPRASMSYVQKAQFNAADGQWKAH